MKSIRLSLWPLEPRLTPATIVVTTVADAGAGSFRDALAQADALPGKDTIKFKLPAPPANSENIITLTTGELTTTGNVTISGPGSGKLIVSGNNASRVFNINDADGATDSPTTIGGLSIVSGNAAGGFGGGIYSLESLTLKGVVVSGNSAGNGAGVRVAGASASVTISNSLIVKNTASGLGGGLDLFNLKSISISKSIISGNSAVNEGGGAYLYLNATTGTGISVTGCTVTGNQASVGGGIRVASSIISADVVTTLKGCTIAGNTSTSTGVDGGGGLSFNGGHSSISGSTISNNTAVYFGGGIHVNGLESLKISKSTISGNRTTATNAADQGGGGVAIVDFGAATLKPATITGCSILNNSSAWDGGGVLAKNGVSLTISSSKFTSNRAVTFGGGVATIGAGANKTNLEVKSSTFASNYSAFGGGAILAGGEGKLSVLGTKIIGNTAVNYGGGIAGISLGAAGEIVIKNTIVSGNVSSAGGGLYIGSTPNFQISGGSIANNSGTTGGGVFVANSTGTIQGTSITGNTATTAGGGVYNFGGGTLALQISKVVGNTAPTDPNVFGPFTAI